MIRTAQTIDELQIDIQAQSNGAAANIDALTKSLVDLRGAVKGGAGLTTVSKQFERFSQSIRGMSDPSGKIASLVSALKPLEYIGKTNLGSTLNQLKKISEITDGLDDAKLTAFAAKIQQVTIAVAPLALEMEKVSQGFSKLPANIQRAINANAKLTSSNKKTSHSYGILGTGISAFTARLSIAYLLMRRVARVIGGWIKESNDYVENLNLFTVAMGKYAGEAQKYAEHVGEVLGIDPSEWMRNQGVFMTLLTGFGNAADKAAVMSKNLTALGYDLSSFFNISFADSMQKLQSGISGELEPLRRLGYDLSQAKLEAIALSFGIDKSVSSMTQAEKSQLRYYAIMTQVTTAQGDMARTLEAPANQLRIFASQAKQAGRALGNIFIPMLNAVLPYAIAFLKVIRWVGQELANLFGFMLPEVDYSGLQSISTGAGEAEDALGGAADAAKELKKAALGIDELNVLRENTGAGSGGAGGVTGDLGFELPQYDFLAGIAESKISKIFDGWKKKLEPTMKWLKENWDSVMETVTAIGAAMLAWKIASGVTTFFEKIQQSKGLRIALGVTIAVTGFALEFTGLRKIIQGDAKFLDYIKTAIGGALGVGGTALTLTALGVAKGLALKIGAAATIAVAIAAITWELATNINLPVSQQAFLALENVLLAGVIGAMFGGFVGGIIGLSVGTLITIGAIAFKKGVFDGWGARETFQTVIVAMLGAAIGFAFGGLIGAIIGLNLGASVALGSITFKENVQDWVKAHKDFVKTLVLILSTVIGSLFGGLVGGVVGMTIGLSISWYIDSMSGQDKVTTAINNVTYPNGRTGGGRSAVTTVNDKVVGRAIGGFPPTGELFMAREAGPELVGTIGGRTAVANQGQIVEAIREGVYDAVVSANSTNGGRGDSFKFEMEGREITTRVTKRQTSMERMYGRSPA